MRKIMESAKGRLNEAEKGGPMWLLTGVLSMHYIIILAIIE